MTAQDTVVRTPGGVVIGVDTHSVVHVAAAIDSVGRRLGTIEIAVDTGGFLVLEAWAATLGKVAAFGVEGTGSYGLRLCGFLTGQGHTVREVDRPNRQHRRRHGKSDTADAYAAAYTTLAEERVVIPKDRAGQVEDLRYVQVARRSAVKDRTRAVNQIQALIVTAPTDIAEELQGLTITKTIAATTHWTESDNPRRAAIGSLARRCIHLDTEIKQLNAMRDRLVTNLVPDLIEEYGIGYQTAADLVVAAGENPDRLRTEAAFAALCGVSPVDASSGLHQHHRLNRGGNRQANSALYTAAMCRMRSCPETAQYITKKTTEGKTRRDIRRRLQRAIARRVYTHLINNLTTPLT